MCFPFSLLFWNIPVFIVIFYSQKLCKDFLDQLKILIQLLDQDVKKVYEQGEKLAVGIRLI